MITLFIFPSDDHRPGDYANGQRALRSFGDMVTKFNVLPSRRLDLQEDIKTPWYGYIWSNEYLEERLMLALPAYLESDIEAIIFMRLTVKDKKIVLDENDNPKCSQSYRLFRSHVRLKEFRHVPDNPDELKIERALDGFVLGE